MTAEFKLVCDRCPTMRDGSKRIELSLAKLDLEKIKALPDLPPNFFHHVRANDDTPLTGASAAALRLLNHAQYNTFGWFGGIRALHERLSSFLRPYTSQKVKFTGARSTVKVHAGPYGGKKLWYNEAGIGRIRPSQPALASVTTALPRISVLVESRLATAYVLNELLKSLSAGRDEMNTWQSGIVAADTVRLPNLRPTEAEMLDAQCQCESPQDHDTNCHICAVCWAVTRHSDMFFAADGRLMCISYRSVLPAFVESRVLPAFMESGIRDRIVSRVVGPGGAAVGLAATASIPAPPKGSTHDRVYKSIISSTKNMPEPTRLEILGVAREALSDLSTDSFPDSYDGIRVLPEDAFNKSLGPRSSPLVPSFDAAFPFVLVDMVPHYHHKVNFALAYWFENAAKANWIPFVLGVLRRATIETLRESTQPHDGGHVQDLRFTPAQAKIWNTINIAMDHLPGGQRSGRPSTRGDFMTDKKLNNFMEGEIASLVPLTKKRVQLLAESTVASATREEARQRCKPWTREDRVKLARLVNQIESSKKYNPRNFKMPRMKDGAPWPFNEKHMFADEYDPWDWWHKELVIRYVTWLDWCNWAHETQESPATLFGLLIVLWFRNRGVDSFLHFEMTVWFSHPLCYSFGRDWFVLAGTVLRSGFTVIFPTDIDLHYDESLRTATAQPLIVNQMWHDFTARGREYILPGLASLSEETVFYGPLREDLEQPSYPTETVVSRRKRRQAGQAVEVEEESEVPDDDEVEGGDEESALEGDDPGLKIAGVGDDEAGEENADGEGEDGVESEGQRVQRLAKELEARRTALSGRLHSFFLEVLQHFAQTEVPDYMMALKGYASPDRSRR
ncbi:hypothetical protein LTR27_000704 [Elasticomyces elasticus]|nr:hypothetical protein LTR27_000704 [Elasticomyces elasticus]